MLKKCAVTTRVCLTIRTLGIQESLLEGPEDEQADQYNNAENQCKDRYLLDS
jgi:predicted SpoU family rRNA methylase